MLQRIMSPSVDWQSMQGWLPKEEIQNVDQFQSNYSFFIELNDYDCLGKSGFISVIR